MTSPPGGVVPVFAHIDQVVGIRTDATTHAW